MSESPNLSDGLPIGREEISPYPHSHHNPLSQFHQRIALLSDSSIIPLTTSDRH